MKRRFAAVLAIPMFFLVFSSSAGEKVWIGPASGGLWNDAQNWEPAGRMTADDVAVFRPSGSLSLTVAYDGSNYNFAKGMRFESGTTFIGHDPSIAQDDYRGYIRLTSASEGAVFTNDFHVADGAACVISNACIAGAQKRAAIRRTGGGTMTLQGQKWGDDWGKLADWIFEGGVTTLRCEGNNQISAPVHIRSGAVLRSPCDYAFHAQETPIDIDAGGVLDLEGAGTVYMAGFRGAGVLTNVATIGNLSLADGPYRFAGRVYPAAPRSFATLQFLARGDATDEADWKILLADADAFSQVRVEFPSCDGAPLGFAAGIEGPFKVGAIQGNDKPYLILEDEDGNPVDLRASFTNPAKFRAKGSGSMIFTSNLTSIHKSNATTDISGLTGTLGSTGDADVNFGNGTEESWPIFDEKLSFRCEKQDGSPFYFKAPSTKEVTIPGCISGNGTYGFYGKLTLLDINTEGAWWQVRDNADLTVAGGRAAIGGFGLYLYPGSTLTVSNGAYVGAVDKKPTYGFEGNVLKQDDGFAFNSGRALGKMVVTHGGRIVSKVPTTNLEVKDGGVLEMQHNPENVAGTWLFDDGSLNLNMADNGFTFTVLPTTPEFQVKVGPKGMTIRCLAKTNLHSEGFMRCYFGGAFTAAETGDGGLTRRGCGFFEFWKPMTIRGTFANCDGTLRIPNQEAITDATVPLFGTGDFRLGNSRIEYHGDITNAFTARIGTNGRFIYDGAATIRVRESVNRPVQTLALGELTRGGAGAALYFWDNTLGKTYNESGTTVTFTEAPATTADGRIDQPVFTRTSDGTYEFASYTDGEGLKSFTNYADWADADATKTVVTPTTRTHVTADTTVGALKVRGINAVYDTDAPLWIDAGATLTVGNGTTPGCVILGRAGGWGPGKIRGAGTLSFGSREGVVLASDIDHERVSIHTTIDGKDGVTYTCMPRLLDDNNEGIEIYGNNIYAGTTHLAMSVLPMSAGAFSTGVVEIVNGELQGGILTMDCEGLVVPNAIRAAGFGNRAGAASTGAITFCKNGTLAGSVEVYDEARVVARTGARGTFAGPISGKKVWIWKGAGEICFAAANTCTGDVEVVGSTLVLKDEGTAGTGDIRLNDGTLVLENAEAKTIANRIYGKGTVRLAGKGAANLPELVSEDGVGFTLDVATKVATINSLKEIAVITTSRTRPTVLIVADGDISSYSGTLPENVTLYRPGEYVPPGMTIIVR